MGERGGVLDAVRELRGLVVQSVLQGEWEEREWRRECEWRREGGGGGAAAAAAALAFAFAFAFASSSSSSFNLLFFSISSHSDPARLPQQHPPGPSQPRFYTCVLYGRVLTTLCACQLLRALSFLSTSLPGPNYHCRAGSPAATLPMPRRWYGHLVVDVGEQATKGCGDLIFSSHTTFALVGCLAYQAFGNFEKVKKLLWASAVALSLLIVASRKHYTVDVVVAWYVVPLVWSFASRRWTTPERGSGIGSGNGSGSGSGSGSGEKSKSGGGSGASLKQGRKGGKGGRPDRPSSVISVSSGFGFDDDVESGGGGGFSSSCGRSAG